MDLSFLTSPSWHFPWASIRDTTWMQDSDSSPLNLRAVELPKVPQTSTGRVDAESFERDLGTQRLYLHQKNGSPSPYRSHKDKIVNVWIRARSLY